MGDYEVSSLDIKTLLKSKVNILWVLGMILAIRYSSWIVKNFEDNKFCRVSSLNSGVENKSLNCSTISMGGVLDSKSLGLVTLETKLMFSEWDRIAGGYSGIMESYDLNRL